MIAAGFQLKPPVHLGDVLHQVGSDGTIKRLEATQERWAFCVIFTDFEAARDVFTRFLDQNVAFDVHWMRKGRSQSIERSGYQEAAPNV